jgi:hypothetical protein
MVRIAIVLDEYYTSRTIAGMAYTRPGRLDPLAAVLATLGAAAPFEALTVLATQDKAVRAVSPWQDDPYDVLASFTQIIVPALVLVIAVRLPLWRASGAPDRQQQTVRAAAVLVALLGLTQAAEWAAVFTGAHASAWNSRTELLIGGLALSSALTIVAAGLLIRVRRPRGSHGQWRHDWLGDAVLICRRVPVLRHAIGSRAADWVRPRAMTVFVTVSVLAAAGEIGMQAVGERWTDPLLIAWAVTVVAAGNLAFCLLANAVAGFVARRLGSRTRRVAETSVIAGCVAIMVVTAFRDALWSTLTGQPLTSVPALAALTLGAGPVAAAVTAGLLLACRPGNRTPHAVGADADPR